VYEKDLLKVREGQQIVFKLSNAGNEEMTATIFAVGKAFDPITKSVAVHADIKGNKRKDLMPGMYVEARITSDTKKSTVLPDEAILSDGHSKFIFIYEGRKKDSGTHIFRRTGIVTGLSDGGYTEVNGLDQHFSSKKIVVKGAYYLEAQLKKNLGDEEE
jgi:cobalt-zinc-cadmium efflux system membrane fusion protein